MKLRTGTSGGGCGCSRVSGMNGGRVGDGTGHGMVMNGRSERGGRCWKEIGTDVVGDGGGRSKRKIFSFLEM